MVELTVDDLLRWQPVSMALVGARDEHAVALEAEFSWAVGIRSTTPVLPPLRGSEIVVVSSAALDELERLESIHWPEIARHLRDLPIAAVVSDHHDFINHSEGLLAIEVAATGGSDLEVLLNREFTERRGSLYQLGSELARTFSSASIGGLELDGFLRLAGERSDVPLALVAETGRLLASSTGSLDVPFELVNEMPPGRRIPDGEREWICQPVSGVGLPGGVVLVAAVAPPEPGDRARLVLEQTAEALGLMFDRLPPLASISPSREASEILADFAVSGVLAPAARRRLERAAGALDLESTLRLLVDPDGTSEAQPVLRFDLAGSGFAIVDPTGYQRLTSHATGFLVSSPPFAGIERMPDVVPLVQRARRLQQDGLLPDRALDLGIPGSGGALGLLLVLSNVQEDPGQHLDDYVEALLGSLSEYDRGGGMELVETLGGYLDAGASIAPAAERLGVHRNTLAYRIARMEEISGHDLSDPVTRFNLQLAVTLRRLARA